MTDQSLPILTDYASAINRAITPVESPDGVTCQADSKDVDATKEYVKDDDIPRNFRRYVYIAGNKGKVKVGMSINPEVRVRTLETQSGVTFQDVWISPCVTDHGQLEKDLHAEFSEFRTIGEYFSCPFDVIKSYAKDRVDTYRVTREDVNRWNESAEKSRLWADQLAARFYGSDRKKREAVSDALMHERNAHIASGVLAVVLLDACNYRDFVSVYHYIHPDVLRNPVIQWIYKHTVSLNAIAMAYMSIANSVVGDDAMIEIYSQHYRDVLSKIPISEGYVCDTVDLAREKTGSEPPDGYDPC
jgi:hypothetical protein